MQYKDEEPLPICNIRINYASSANLRTEAANLFQLYLAFSSSREGLKWASPNR